MGGSIDVLPVSVSELASDCPEEGAWSTERMDRMPG